MKKKKKTVNFLGSLRHCKLYFFAEQKNNIKSWMSKVLEVLFSDFLWYLKYLTPLFFPLKMTVKYLKIDQVLDRNQVLDTLFFFSRTFLLFYPLAESVKYLFSQKNVKYLIKYPLFFVLDQVLDVFFVKKVLDRGRTSKKVLEKKIGCQVLEVSSIGFFGGSST